ncbi:hypothetical protein [Pontibacter sp. 172403-2]|uniref:hypothetical protein n=1 Tax=Pontibacter rufus TaxID=2791028 RepID=UPI001E52C3C5|nr:hypothetical protein [Pontibacter sp. 172403-2]
MIKIAIIFLAAIGLLFYITRNKPGPDNTAEGRAATSGSATGKFEKLTSLPKEVKESSAIVALPQAGQYLTLNDAGNKPDLYQIDEKGDIVKTIALKVPNEDWEDMTRDTQGNIYIADTGNNNYKRKLLTIYKLREDAPDKIQQINFTYEDQKRFAINDNSTFDAEAIFWYDGNLYVVTKDIDDKTMAKVYRLPDQPGQYTASHLGNAAVDSKITGAAISPKADMVALLADGKLYLFRNVHNPVSFYKGRHQEIDLPGGGQTEGVDFIDENTLIITSEGANLYKYTIE